MEAAISRLSGAGFKEAVLWVLEQNGRARRFHESHHWLPNGATKTLPGPEGAIEVGYLQKLHRREP